MGVRTNKSQVAIGFLRKKWILVRIPLEKQLNPSHKPQKWGFFFKIAKKSVIVLAICSNPLSYLYTFNNGEMELLSNYIYVITQRIVRPPASIQVPSKCFKIKLLSAFTMKVIPKSLITRVILRPEGY